MKRTIETFNKRERVVRVVMEPLRAGDYAVTVGYEPRIFKTAVAARRHRDAAVRALEAGGFTRGAVEETPPGPEA